MTIINIGNRIVNNYLIRLSDGWLVIDTGYPGSYSRFKKGLAINGIDKKDIKYIFVSHAHDDHVGFLNEIMTDTEAKIIMHHETAERLLVGHNKYKGGCSNMLAKLFVCCMGIFGKAKHEFPIVRVPENTLLWNGERQFFKELGYDIEIITLKGHTSDQIGLLINNNLFCADAAMSGFPSIKRNIIWIEDLEDYRNTWYLMINSKAETIYPAHGKPFPKTDLIKYYDNLKTIILHKTKISE